MNTKKENRKWIQPQYKPNDPLKSMDLKSNSLINLKYKSKSGFKFLNTIQRN